MPVSWIRETTRAGRMVAPDMRLGGSPAWYRCTVEESIERRPGRGAGGGRPQSGR